MYERHFGFRERPFALTPDPTYLYRSQKHGMALAVLEYGLLSQAPIIVVTGEIGAGKTTLIRYLLDQFDERTTVGLISNTHKAFGDLMQWVCIAFGIDFSNRTKAEMYQAIVDFLISEYSNGHRTILIVDEAQNMDSDTLEELRLITNINSDKNVVLQLLLAGQPELRDTLQRKELKQFAQRVAADFHLPKLNLKETREYIQHRLAVAGGNRNVFRPDAILEVFKLADGVPRLINLLCDQALVYAFAEGRLRVTEGIVRMMAADRLSNNMLATRRLD